MYRQVWVDEEQVPLQRIIWRGDPRERLKEFELLTLTYGTEPASFLAINAIQTLARMKKEKYPIESQIVLRDFYVDDLITGANSMKRALQIRNETMKLLAEGGFILRKWASNERTLIEDVPANSAGLTRSLDKGGVLKTLGIHWNPVEDMFQYKISVDMKQNQRVTKRIIMAVISRIFDPLGFLGPIVILAKLIIQRLWNLQVNWDESLPFELHTDWTRYKSQIMQLNEFRIPCKVAAVHAIMRVKLHGFCDASQEAYGACIYMRVSDQNGTHQVNLLCAKSRIAPLKSISIPRLELCGAQLLAQLIDKIIPILDLEIHQTCCWTDSTIVLGWIKSPSRRFNTFVANWIGEIQERTQVEDWRHVGTADNPADILSRGACSEVLKISEL
ncbi:uncharacterized protein [Linepithema humile]|uniref:uncharacterized protein n=1 Tax=Linepithema humile TaxID=83485 RepID=UPI00351F7F09